MDWGLIEKTARIIEESRYIIALTGAGISTESGVPDFRSADGIWNRYDPSVFFYQHFLNDPVGVWNIITDMYANNDVGIWQAQPNRGHTALATLEKKGRLRTIITQNIDNLHQHAGNRHVIEFHGNMLQARCIKCRRLYDFKAIVRDFDRKWAPSCDSCGGLLKPDAIFFGEAIPQQALQQANQAAQMCDLMLVIGTSAQVEPAASLPMIAKGLSPLSLHMREEIPLIKTNAHVIEINREPTPLTSEISDYIIQGSSGEVLSAIVKQLNGSKG